MNELYVNYLSHTQNEAQAPRKNYNCHNTQQSGYYCVAINKSDSKVNFFFLIIP